jgi:hypothetical protein
MWIGTNACVGRTKYWLKLFDYWTGPTDLVTSKSKSQDHISAPAEAVLHINKNLYSSDFPVKC